jgi:multimeric flavodoxin WrbA
MITIICDIALSSQGLEILNKINGAHKEVKYFDLENINIEPCYACRSCEEKTYSRCIVRDDADMILPYLARSEAIIVLTPIVFGGYSLPVKRIIDKLSLIGDKHYYFRKGELVKRFSRDTKYFAIGLLDEAEIEEIDVFKQLVMETINIGSCEGRSIVIPREKEEYNNFIREMTAL